MRRRARVHDPERPAAYFRGPDRREDLKALVLKLVKQIGDVQEVARLTGVPRPTIYRIQVWNTREDLTNRRGQGAGRKPKLSAEAWEKVKERPRSRERLGMRYGKPYVTAYRRSQEDEALLAERVHRVFGELRAQGVRAEEIAIGFVDETSPQNRANSQRMWSFGPFRMQKNTDRMRVNAVGFYALKGNDVLTVEDVNRYVRRLRETWMPRS